MPVEQNDPSSSNDQLVDASSETATPVRTDGGMIEQSSHDDESGIEARTPVISASEIEPAEHIDPEKFFCTPSGTHTIVTGVDLQRTIDDKELEYTEEIDRYWVTYPYAYVSICKSLRDNEYRYYLVEPGLSESESRLVTYLIDEIQITIRNEDQPRVDGELSDERRRSVIREKVIELLQRYGLNDGSTIQAIIDSEDTGAPWNGYEEQSIENDRIHRDELLGEELNSSTDTSDGGLFDGIDLFNGENESTETVEASAEVSKDVTGKDGGGGGIAETGLKNTITQLFTDASDRRDEAQQHQDPHRDLLPTTETAEAYGADLRQPYLSPTQLIEGHPVLKSFRDTTGVPFGAVIEASHGEWLYDDDTPELTDYQVLKILYYIERDFLGYQKIDGIKHDVNVEDISCDGYEDPVFVYHSEYGQQILTNVVHDPVELDRFIRKIAQEEGKELSRRNPQVDVILEDGSRSQLTLGTEVSDKGTNYTIRQFKDVPFTPIDLVNWGTFSIEEAAFLWLCVEHDRSMIVAGGTATGKTTTMNAFSMFVPASNKIVTIEDTRELSLPQKNWVSMVTREAVGDEESSEIDEFDLLESSLRQRPDYLLMGEVRGEEGRVLFQLMSTGHTSYSTFHADNVSELTKRFTSDPINVSKSVFTTLDLVTILGQTHLDGTNVRRAETISEVGDYDTQNDQLSVRDIFKWSAKNDEHIRTSKSEVLAKIRQEQGWSIHELQYELFAREVMLSYLIANDIQSYDDVSAAFQAFMNDQGTTLTLLSQGKLTTALEELKTLKTLDIEVDDSAEQHVPRPSPSDETRQAASELLSIANAGLFEQHSKTDQVSIGVVKDVIESETVSNAERDFTGEEKQQINADLITTPAEEIVDRGVIIEEESSPVDDTQREVSVTDGATLTLDFDTEASGKTGQRSTPPDTAQSQSESQDNTSIGTTDSSHSDTASAREGPNHETDDDDVDDTTSYSVSGRDSSDGDEIEQTARDRFTKGPERTIDFDGESSTASDKTDDGNDESVEQAESMNDTDEDGDGDE